MKLFLLVSRHRPLAPGASHSLFVDWSKHKNGDHIYYKKVHRYLE